MSAYAEKGWHGSARNDPFGGRDATGQRVTPAPRTDVSADPCFSDDERSRSALTHATRWVDDPASSGRATAVTHRLTRLSSTTGVTRAMLAGSQGTSEETDACPIWCG